MTALLQLLVTYSLILKLDFIALHAMLWKFKSNETHHPAYFSSHLRQ